MFEDKTTASDFKSVYALTMYSFLMLRLANMANRMMRRVFGRSQPFARLSSLSAILFRRVSSCGGKKSQTSSFLCSVACYILSFHYIISALYHSACVLTLFILFYEGQCCVFCRLHARAKSMRIVSLVLLTVASELCMLLLRHKRPADIFPAVHLSSSR